MKKIINLSLSMLVLLSFFSINIVKAKKLEDMTTKEYVRKLGAGFDLGNTYDKNYNYLKEPDLELFKTIKSHGFTTVRFAVSWIGYLDSNDNIDKEFMSKVKKGVDNALKAGLFVSLDTMHDGSIDPHFEVNLDPSKYNETSKHMKKIWSQIAKEFKDYDYHLMFGTMNEPLDYSTGSPSWDPADNGQYETLNKINNDIISTIRSTGSNNVKRFIIAPTYAAKSNGNAVKYFNVKDSSNHTIVAMHEYDNNNLQSNGKTINAIKTLQNKGYAVIMREVGTGTTNTTEENINKFESNFKTIFNNIKETGASAWLWDDGGNMSFLKNRFNGNTGAYDFGVWTDSIKNITNVYKTNDTEDIEDKIDTTVNENTIITTSGCQGCDISDEDIEKLAEQIISSGGGCCTSTKEEIIEYLKKARENCKKNQNSNKVYNTTTSNTEDTNKVEDTTKEENTTNEDTNKVEDSTKEDSTTVIEDTTKEDNAVTDTTTNEDTNKVEDSTKEDSTKEDSTIVTNNTSKEDCNKIENTSKEEDTKDTVNVPITSSKANLLIPMIGLVGIIFGAYKVIKARFF